MDQAVSLELLVKGEHGTLGDWVGVTGTTTATKEELGGGGWRDRCCRGSDTPYEVRGRNLAVVTGTAATAVVDGGSVDWSVGDLDGHCDLLLEDR